MENKTFSERLSELLEKRGMTQKELALRIGVTEASLSRYMNSDRKPRSEVLANIATALQTTSDYLLGVEEEGNIDSDYPRIIRLIARNSANLTAEQKKAIINELMGD